MSLDCSSCFHWPPCVVRDVTTSAPLYDSLVAVTPDVSNTLPVDAQRQHLAVNVIFDGGPTVFTKQYFDFRPNANITGVSPTDHLITYVMC